MWLLVDWNPLDIRIARVRAGLKIKDLADLSGIKAARLGRIESGASKPRLIEIRKIEDVLGVTLLPPHQEAER